MADRRVWTLDEANAALGHVTEIVERVRDSYRAERERVETVRSNGKRAGGEAAAAFAAAVDELASEGIALRDAEEGLVDFPARTAGGRAYWLCWIVGEPSVRFWHWPDEGFAGRRPVAVLPSD